MFEKLVSLKTSKAPGPDRWPAEVFKQCADHLCVPLSILFSKSLESSVLPDYWKIGQITLIYKKGNKTKVITCSHLISMDLCLKDHAALNYCTTGPYHLMKASLLM